MTAIQHRWRLANACGDFWVFSDVRVISLEPAAFRFAVNPIDPADCPVLRGDFDPNLV